MPGFNLEDLQFSAQETCFFFSLKPEMPAFVILGCPLLTLLNVRSFSHLYLLLLLSKSTIKSLVVAQ